MGYAIVTIAAINTVMTFLFPISQTLSAPFNVFFLVVFVAFSVFLVEIYYYYYYYHTYYYHYFIWELLLRGLDTNG